MFYAPESPPIVADSDVNEVLRWTHLELQRLAGIMADNVNSTVTFEEQNVVPARLREGLTAKADGTNWNPGAGEGLYMYLNGTWTKII